MEWATAMVDEPRNVAHVTAKDVGVPEAFGSSTRRLLSIHLFLARRALARQMAKCWHLCTDFSSLEWTQNAPNSWFDSAQQAPSNQLSLACRGRTAERRSVPECVSRTNRSVFRDYSHLRVDPARTAPPPFAHVTTGSISVAYARKSVNPRIRSESA